MTLRVRNTCVDEIDTAPKWTLQWSTDEIEEGYYQGVSPPPYKGLKPSLGERVNYHFLEKRKTSNGSAGGAKL